jgi:predicted enzyme related to lactoylglutathione lyase
MALHLSHTTVDAHDPHAQAEFWSALASWNTRHPEDDSEDEAYLTDDNGFTTLFLRVPDSKTVKNRLHFDLRPVDATRDQEVDRAISLGATVVDDRRAREGWVTFADPEGNEFCILDG